jgi:hypothetical protein
MTTGLPTETSALKITDGETGSILAGFAFDPASRWTEYEVATRDGIERWTRTEFVLMAEIEDNT